MLTPSQRSTLGRNLASHVLAAAAGSGSPFVVTRDETVERWATDRGAQVLREPSGAGLSGAAEFAVAAAGSRPWLVVHSDLPWLSPADLEALFAAAGDGSALAPSHDGGTSGIAGSGGRRFAYGPGSFRRHLASSPRPVTVAVRRGFLVDVDGIADLDRMPDSLRP